MNLLIGRDEPARADAAWDRRLSALARLIGDWQPAVIAMQDATRAQLEALAGALPDYRPAVEHRRWIENGAYTAIFTRTAEVEVDDSRDVWLSETPRVRGSSSWGATAPVVAALVELRHLASRRRLLVVSAQLDPVNEKVRLEQAGVLLSQVAKGNDEKRPVILAGAFFEPPDAGVYRLLTGRRILHATTGNLQDGWRRLARGEADGGTRVEGGRIQGPRTDWIMFDAGVEIQDLVRFVDPVDGVWPSPHTPLGAELLV
jgi:endonuclease/exonuclease/phosphatase family metal-dependent hydrolase